MVQLTERDEAMLDWLSVVRLTEVDPLRYALAAFSRAEQPVSLRRAQQWVARLTTVGMLDRTRPTMRDGSVVWATHQAIGKSAPSLLRQTLRHELAVAAVSARYVFHGYEWARDRRPRSLSDHQGDGVAIKGDQRDLIEVELTTKTLSRYPHIFYDHARRLENDEFTKVVYFGTDNVTRILAREVDKHVFRTIRPRILILPTFDERGVWISEGDLLNQVILGDELGAVSAQS